MLGERVKTRICNWKFSQAWELLEGELAAGTATDHELATLRALSDLVGNAGWFGGSLGTVVDAAVRTLIPDRVEM